MLRRKLLDEQGAYGSCNRYHSLGFRGDQMLHGTGTGELVALVVKGLERSFSQKYCSL
jgi:hypothetical protein